MLAPNVQPTVASVFAPRTVIDADGTVEGYASLFGETDQARDMVMRGAFAETLALRRSLMLLESAVQTVPHMTAQPNANRPGRRAIPEEGRA